MRSIHNDSLVSLTSCCSASSKKSSAISRHQDNNQQQHNNNLPLKPAAPPSTGLTSSLSAGALAGGDTSLPKQPFAQDSCMPRPGRPDSRTQVDEAIRRLQEAPSAGQQQQLMSR